MKSKYALRSLLGSAILAAALLPSAAMNAQAAIAAPIPQADYYLALGDSLTVGFQPDPAVSWTHGWVYQLRDMLAKTAPIELTNLGHNGECSDTFISGGLAKDCPTKDVDSPSQLAEATGFIGDHPGRVRLITVEIGGNDLNGNRQLFLSSSADQQKAILAGIFPKLAQDWSIIFGSLRKACPICEIIALNQYNPFPEGATKADLATLFQTYTGLLRQATTPAHVRLADVYTPFVGHELAYTWMAKNNIHPNTTGYKVMAEIVARVVTAPVS